MRRLRYLLGKHRAPATNRALGFVLAFNAGAINAGGFFALHTYTSHMTGFASQLADGAVFGQWTIVWNALGAIIAFVVGAATCAVLVNWARRHHLHSVYALPILLEAGLLLPFGLMGAVTLRWETPFAVPLTVLLLSFIMGLQNAVSSKTSRGGVRTTHMTGNITDLGMELGKFLQQKGHLADAKSSKIRYDLTRAQLSGGLVALFIAGGFVGAFGFKYAGFVFVVPLAAMLVALVVPTLWRDWPRFRTSLRLATRPGAP